jgi:hypothetical protein
MKDPTKEERGGSGCFGQFCGVAAYMAIIHREI